MPKLVAAPGVYLEDVTRKPKPEFTTGVPAFLGYDGAPPGGGITAVDASLWARSYAQKAYPGHLGTALRGFFENGGRRCYVVPLDPLGGAAGLESGLVALDPNEDFDLICAPDLVSSSAADLAAGQAQILDFCARRGGCFAILDAVASTGGGVDQDIAAAKAHRELLATALAGEDHGANGALYFPWIKVQGGAGFAPPSGHVAGVYARTDRSVGVHKPPANEEILGIVDLESHLGAAQQELLNPVSINCLRPFPGRGMRVWGARTLSGKPAWTYVSVRRLVLTVGRWVEQNMTGIVFEPNNARLWIRVNRELDAYLGRLFDQGALKGKSAVEAYFVKCDGENNPPSERDAGRIIIDVGLAPISAGEFIVVRVTQGEGAAGPDGGA